MPTVNKGQPEPRTFSLEFAMTAGLTPALLDAEHAITAGIAKQPSEFMLSTPSQDHSPADSPWRLKGIGKSQALLGQYASVNVPLTGTPG